MPTSEADVTVSKIDSPDLTEAAQDALLANSEHEQDRRLAWDRIIDQILKWVSNPELLAYPEIDPISRDLLRSAIDYAVVARDALWVIYSVGKEDVAVSRIPLSELPAP